MSSYVSGQSSGYCVVPIDDACSLAEAARTEGVDYTYAFYQVGTRSEAVKKNKLMVLISRKTNACFDDPDVCRKKLGLEPDEDAKVNSKLSSEYNIFVQSTSTNRGLKPGTSALFSVDLSKVPQGKKTAKKGAKKRDESEEEEEEDEKPKRTTRKRTKRDEEEEEEAPKKRTVAKRGKKKEESEEEEEEEEEEEKPNQRGKKSSIPSLDLSHYKKEDIPEKQLRSYKFITAAHFSALEDVTSESMVDWGMPDFSAGFSAWLKTVTLPKKCQPESYDDLFEKAEETTQDDTFTSDWCAILCAYITAKHKAKFMKFFDANHEHLQPAEGEDDEEEEEEKPKRAPAKKGKPAKKQEESEEEEEEEKPKSKKPPAKKAKKAESEEEEEEEAPKSKSKSGLEEKEEAKLTKAKSGPTPGVAKHCGKFPYGLAWNNDEDTLFCLDSPSLPGSDKIVGFDMDSTLIVPKSGAKFPTGPSDWVWWNPAVVPKLQEYHKNGYKLVIFTNQAGIEKGKQKPGDITTKILALSEQAKVPLQAFAAAATNHWRKPHRAMWDEFVANHNQGVKPNLSECIYVGDAAGRPKNWQPGAVKDFGCGDRKFAANIGVTFMTPEEFFLGLKTPAPFSMDSLDPAKYLKACQGGPANGFTGSSITKPSQEMIVFCAKPASGKSTFYRTHLSDYVWVNRDTLKTPAKCAKAAIEGLASGKSVVIDNTCPDVSTRAEYIGIAKKAGVPVRCFLFDTPKEVSEHLNFFREAMTLGKVRRIPDVGFNMFNSKFRAPSTSEGFSEVCTIKFVPQFKNDKDKQLFLEWTE